MFVISTVHGMTREHTHSPKDLIRLDETQYCKTMTFFMDLYIISTHADEGAKKEKNPISPFSRLAVQHAGVVLCSLVSH